MKINIQRWIINRMKKMNCRAPHSNQGMIIAPRSPFLKKHKNVKKYNVVVFGDTVDELYKNFKKIELDILMMKECPVQEGVN